MKRTLAPDEQNDVSQPDTDEHPALQQELKGESQNFVSRPLFTIRHTASGDCRFQPHSHPAFTVTAILSGHMTATIGAEDFKLSAGQVALTNMGQHHAGQRPAVEFISIGISPALIDELIAEIGLINTTAEIVFRKNVVNDEAIIATARMAASEIASERPGRNPMLDALVRQLIIHLLRSHLTVRKTAQIELSRAGPVDRRLRRAIEFMHDNYSRELSLEEIASAAYLSEYHFARLFKQITGITPHAYLASLRLERARRLLAETGLAISEISTRVGYQSQSHFTKIFKSV